MWKAIPSGVLAIAFISATVILGLVTWGIRFSVDDRMFVNFLFVTIFAATPVLTFSLVIGRSTLVWHQLCSLFPALARKYDVSGTWEGKIRSTFPVGIKVEGADLYEGVMTMEITQS